MLLSIDGMNDLGSDLFPRSPSPPPSYQTKPQTRCETSHPPTPPSLPSDPSLSFQKWTPSTPESASHSNYLYVGGTYVDVDDDPGQRVMQGQMYVEQLTPLGGEPRRPLPLVFIHGGGQTASVRFVRSGFPFPFTTSNVVWICTSTCRRALLRIGIIISLAQNFLLKNS